MLAPINFRAHQWKKHFTLKRCYFLPGAITCCFPVSSDWGTEGWNKDKQKWQNCSILLVRKKKKLECMEGEWLQIHFVPTPWKTLPTGCLLALCLSLQIKTYTSGAYESYAQLWAVTWPHWEQLPFAILFLAVKSQPIPCILLFSEVRCLHIHKCIVSFLSGTHLDVTDQFRKKMHYL